MVFECLEPVATSVVFNETLKEAGATVLLLRVMRRSHRSLRVLLETKIATRKRRSRTIVVFTYRTSQYRFEFVNC
jgi:hypothetical protein